MGFCFQNGGNGVFVGVCGSGNPPICVKSTGDIFFLQFVCFGYRQRAHSKIGFFHGFGDLGDLRIIEQTLSLSEIADPIVPFAVIDGIHTEFHQFFKGFQNGLQPLLIHIQHQIPFFILGQYGSAQTYLKIHKPQCIADKAVLVFSQRDIPVTVYIQCGVLHHGDQVFHIPVAGKNLLIGYFDVVILRQILIITENHRQIQGAVGEIVGGEIHMVIYSKGIGSLCPPGGVKVEFRTAADIQKIPFQCVGYCLIVVVIGKIIGILAALHGFFNSNRDIGEIIQQNQLQRTVEVLHYLCIGVVQSVVDGFPFLFSGIQIFAESIAGGIPECIAIQIFYSRAGYGFRGCIGGFFQNSSCFRNGFFCLRFCFSTGRKAGSCQECQKKGNAARPFVFHFRISSLKYCEM